MLEPEAVIHFENSKHGFDGGLVIDNTLLGPGSGGVRILPDVNEVELKILAKAMTRKNAFFNLPAGGAKAGIICHPQSRNRDKVISAFGAAVSDMIRRFRYVPSPDMGSTESDIIGIYRQVGAESLLRNSILLKTLNGIPLARLSTAEGVVEAVIATVQIANQRIKDCSVAIEGFGRLGSLIGVMLVEHGFKITAVSTAEETLLQQTGINVHLLTKIQQQNGKVALQAYAKSSPSAEIGSSSLINDQPVDVLIPAARPLLITKSNADRVQSNMIVPCANAPVDESAEKPLAERGIIVVPDFISNAGGVLGGFLCRLNVPIQRLRSLVREEIRKGVTTVLKNSGNSTPGELARQLVDEKLEFARRHSFLSKLWIAWHWKTLLSRPSGISAVNWYARHRLNI